MRNPPQSELVGAIIAPPIGPVGDFSLVDVGASGGIGWWWAAFGEALVAVGFDPLVTNMRKVAAAETRPRVTYESAFVGCAGFDTLFPNEQRWFFDPYRRSSAVRAEEILHVDFVADHFNEGDELVWSDRHVILDERFPDGSSLDFLKVDTDGSDIQVLLGADRLLREGGFLGVMVEAQLHGPPHDYANTWANIDRYLRARGFTFYDIALRRYTRAALPGDFEYAITAETRAGQLLWGDALYLRDLADQRYGQLWQYDVTRARILKLAALFDFHGLPDCAAELLLAHPGLTTEAERTTLLDMLVKSAGFSATFAEHRRRFEERPTSFYPEPPTPPPPALPPPRPSLLRRAARKAKRLLQV
jgi:hypothetical protein